MTSLAICAVALLGATNILATSYTSAGGGGDWSSTGTWSPSGVPGSGDTAAIAAAAPVSVSDTEAVTSITIQKGATLSVATGGNTSTVAGLAYSNLTLLADAGSSAFNLGASGLSVSGNLTFGGASGATALVTAWPAGASIPGQVVFNATKGITFPSVFSIGGLSQSSGTVTVPSAGTLTVTGAFTTTGGAFTTAAGSMVSFTGAAPVIGGTVTNNFANLSIGAGTSATNTAPLNVTNVLPINPKQPQSFYGLSIPFN